MILLPGLLVSLFLARLLLSDFIPLTFDLFLYFYPYKEAAARAWAEGRVPLWNPALFLGVPFLGNVQTAFFYPFNVLLYPLSAPQQVEWGIWLHLVLAGTLAYVYLRRSLGLSGRASALGAGLFALGGYLGALAEHPNQLAASAWLPAIFLLLDLGAAWTPALGAVLGLVFLAGHSQAAYILLVGAGLYAVARPPGRPSRLLMLALATALGFLVAAVQLLPALELSRHSLRAGGLSYSAAVSFSLSPRMIAQALLPPGQRGLFSEFVAYVGVSGLVLAGFGLRDRRARPPALLAAAGLFLALGGYNPAYSVLYRLVPGFDLFRAPARWLLLFAWGVSVLAALGFERWSGAAARPALPRLTRRAAFAGLAVLLLLALQRFPPLPTLLVWLVAVLAAAAALRQLPRRAAISLALLLLLELAWGARFQGYNQLLPARTYEGWRTAPAYLATRQPPVRVLSFSGLTWDPGDLHSLGSELDPTRAYELVVAIKEKEILAPNLPMVWGVHSVDGYDGGLLPTKDFYQLTLRLLSEGAGPPHAPAPGPAGGGEPPPESPPRRGGPGSVPRRPPARPGAPAPGLSDADPERLPLDGRLWQHLRWPPDEELLDLLAVDYLLMDKLHDVWVEDVFYDLAFTARGPVRIEGWAGFPATALGAVFQEEAVVSVAGETYTLRPEGEPVLVDERGRFYHLVVSWGEPRGVESIELVRGGVQGLTLIDGRTETFQPLVAAPGGTWRLVHSGDVKIYHNLDARSRVWPGELVHYQPGRVEAVVEGPATAVLAESDLPGWTAAIDGRPAPIGRAEPFFPAVEVPDGVHRVRFDYQPLSYRWGLRLTLLGLVGLAAAAIPSVARRRV